MTRQKLRQLGWGVLMFWLGHCTKWLPVPVYGEWLAREDLASEETCENQLYQFFGLQAKRDALSGVTLKMDIKFLLWKMEPSI